MKFLKYKEQSVVNMENVDYFHKENFLKNQYLTEDIFCISFKSRNSLTWNFTTKEERDKVFKKILEISVSNYIPEESEGDTVRIEDILNFKNDL